MFTYSVYQTYRDNNNAKKHGDFAHGDSLAWCVSQAIKAIEPSQNVESVYIVNNKTNTMIFEHELLETARLTRLATAFNLVGGMDHEDTPENERIYNALVDAVDMSACHEAANDFVKTLIPNFNY